MAWIEGKTWSIDSQEAVTELLVPLKVAAIGPATDSLYKNGVIYTGTSETENTALILYLKFF